MNTKTHLNNVYIYNATLYYYICYTTIALILCYHMNTTTHEYNDRVGLLIQNRTTGHYAHEFTVFALLRFGQVASLFICT